MARLSRVPARGRVAATVGHQLWAECEIAVSGDITAVEAHGIAVDAEHDLLHALPRRPAALVHTDPQAHQDTDPHAVLDPHR
jgi:divalent metal cation (Fe/Co/Zn/Cd) transporter